MDEVLELIKNYNGKDNKLGDEACSLCCHSFNIAKLHDKIQNNG